MPAILETIHNIFPVQDPHNILSWNVGDKQNQQKIFLENLSDGHIIIFLTHRDPLLCCEAGGKVILFRQ